MVKSTFKADHPETQAESKQNPAMQVVMVCFPALMMSASSSPVKGMSHA
jgi:hypothetical protein